MTAWYLILLGIGVGFMPMTCFLCKGFRDGGWIVSKTIGIMLSVWVFFILNVVRFLPFTRKFCWLIILILFVFNLVFFVKQKMIESFTQLDIRLILTEEIVFALMFVLWLRIISYHPEAYDTEKFMDYGFMTTMMRSLYMPFEDLWYSGEPINYYYGGQFVATWLVKLSGISVGVGYNTMRATIAAFSFSLPFELGFQIMADKFPKQKWTPYAAGTLSGTAVAYCGNMHYIVYGIVQPLLGLKDTPYWIPDATRYIGYNPDLPDKTIHEFPAYSTLLGDLHAHYINTIFVVSVTIVAYAYGRRKLMLSGEYNKSNRRPSFLKIDLPEWLREGMCQPEIWIIGIFTGLFRWTNFWDFPIYVVVCGSIVFFANLQYVGYRWKRFVPMMTVQTLIIFLSGTIAALPFTLTFRMIASEVYPTHTHSVFYQLAVLWGLPYIVVILFTIVLIYEFITRKKVNDNESSTKPIKDYPDMAVLLLGFCAAGLVFLPEVIYVKDIYDGDSYRANTMFKLTYQAFILFGMVMPYVLMRLLLTWRKFVKGLSLVGLICLILTAGYTVHGVRDWFGNIFDSSMIVSQDASVFVGKLFPEDLGGIRYLNQNVKKPVVILEAPGDSYTAYERVSVATGLATPLGWYVHEWLWRSDTDSLNARGWDIEMIYTNTDENYVRELIQKYNIKYIYVGKLEREKYEAINDEVLQRMGEVVYSDENTYIVMTSSY